MFFESQSTAGQTSLSEQSKGETHRLTGGKGELVSCSLPQCTTDEIGI